jgi:hypothetical protein
MDGYAKPKDIVNPYIRYGSYFLLAAFFVYSVWYDLSDIAVVTAVDMVYSLFSTAWTLLIGIVSVFCGNYCAKISAKISKSPDLAYCIGFFLSIPGLIGYWIYFRVLTKKKV